MAKLLTSTLRGKAPRLAAALLLSASITACSTMGGIFTEPLSERIEEHVEVLAADEMGGRDTGSEGYDMAAAYVADFFAANGIEPAVPDYKHMVPLTQLKVASIEGELTLRADGDVIDLVPGETVAFSSPSDGVGEGYEARAEGDLVFVGHGVHAPELGIDDYRGVDVDGKIVVFLSGTPEIEDNPSAVHLRRFDVKRQMAAERGAIGIITLDTSGNTIERIQEYIDDAGDRTQVSLPAALDRPMPRAYLAMEPAETLFAASGRDLDEVVEAAEAGEFASFALDGSAVLTTRASNEPLNAYNVVGVIPGNDPALAGEAVVITAHLDHVGTRDDGDPDTDDIYNGALDNATGTAIIMEAARMIEEAGGAGRTILVAAVTAEEKGLLGAAHLARNVEELGYTPVANVNIDMPVLTYPLNDIIAFGSEYSSLGPQFDATASEVGIVATPDPLPELSLFVRSDHYRFVQEGIPSLFLFNGMAGEGKENFQSFMATHYHKPSDETDLDINWNDAAKFARITSDLVQRIANDPQRPTWNEGVVFTPEEPQG